MYVQDKTTKEVVYGHALSRTHDPNTKRIISDKKSHLMIVDKIVAEMYVGDTFLDKDEQIRDRVIK
jgi:hypothetical protein